jgi:5-methylcytosine-specific restriction endonuclease McrBC GTP-binding regulatory subunit McrB
MDKDDIATSWNEDSEQLEKFQAEWPIERIKNISVEEYVLNGSNYKQSLSYALEFGTAGQGGIRGGSSYKHGIFLKTDGKEYTVNNRYDNDDKYAWDKKYGLTSQDAFQTIKKCLIDIVSAIQSKDLKKIDSVDFYSMLKWKLTYLCNPTLIIPVYNYDALALSARILGFVEKDASYETLYKFFISQKPEDINTFKFGTNIWAMYKENKDINHYIIGSKYGAIDVFPKFLENSCIATGFAQGEDLSDFYNKQEKEIVQYLSSKGEEKKSYNCLKKFLNIKVGDLIAVKSNGSPRGSKGAIDICAIAKVVENNDQVYTYDPELLGHQINVEFINAPVNHIFDIGGYGQTVHKLSKNEHIKEIFEYDYEKIKMPEVVSDNSTELTSLNQILYGPPGTGKTYNSLNLAVSICENSKASKVKDECKTTKGRDNVRERYEQYKKNGQIAFTTFHQSLSYEDFVEGIKPILGNEDLSYDIIDGIFKDISDKALKNYKRSEDTTSVSNFQQSFETLKLEWEDSENDEVPIPMKTEGKSFHITSFTNKSINFRKPSGGTGHNLSIKTLEDIFNDEREFGSGLKSYYEPLIHVLKTKYSSTKPANIERQNYVLIIDEINRGNVSAILGELITLLEDDKRFDKKEAISVTLPYSKEEFFVPPNLHIIGTMNTADRSVEALDTALRRRFSFIEMPPDSSIIDSQAIGADISLSKMLDSINSKLEILVGRDNTIGHAFFIEVDTVEKLNKVFRDKVIPQLQEYFYGDWAKIGLILGEKFVVEKETQAEVHWHSKFSRDEITDRVIYKIHEEEWTADDFKSIYQDID